MSIMVELREIRAREKAKIEEIKSYYAALFFRMAANLLEGNKVRIVKRDQRGNVYYDKIVIVKDVIPCHDAELAIRPEHDHGINIPVNSWDELIEIKE